MIREELGGDDIREALALEVMELQQA
jgi:hypothetical protein